MTAGNAQSTIHLVPTGGALGADAWGVDIDSEPVHNGRSLLRDRGHPDDVLRVLDGEGAAPYGDAAFDTDLFTNAPLNGTGATTNIKRMVLRAGSDRSWTRCLAPQTTFTEEQFYQDSQIAMSGVGSRGLHCAALSANLPGRVK